MTIILALHILLMVASLSATSVFAIAAALSHRIRIEYLKLNAAITALGMLLGTGLLMRNPLDIKCAILLGYLFAFGLVYAYVSRRNQSLAESAV